MRPCTSRQEAIPQKIGNKTIGSSDGRAKIAKPSVVPIPMAFKKFGIGG